jgi:hypothetical protein
MNPYLNTQFNHYDNGSIKTHLKAVMTHSELISFKLYCRDHASSLVVSILVGPLIECLILSFLNQPNQPQKYEHNSCDVLFRFH